MSRTLIEDKGDISSVVAYVVSLPIPDPPATAEGDAEAGEEEYTALCANCHGGDGRGVDTGVQELNAPSLLHLNDWYIASSLRKYRDGVRGVGDAAGATMRAPASDMSDERIANVTAFVMTMQRLPRKAASPPPPPLAPLEVDPASLPEGVTVAMAEEGQAIFNGTTGICFTCHLREGTRRAPGSQPDRRHLAQHRRRVRVHREPHHHRRAAAHGAPRPNAAPGGDAAHRRPGASRGRLRIHSESVISW